MAVSDLTQALSLAPFRVDGFAVNLDGLTADVTAFETGAPHAGADLLDDQGFEMDDARLSRSQAGDDAGGNTKSGGFKERLAWKRVREQCSRIIMKKLPYQHY